eukprot:241230-Pyramimonas_sp.AAC.2
MASQVHCATMYTSLSGTSSLVHKQRIAQCKGPGCGSKSRPVVLGSSDAQKKPDSQASSR